MPIIFKNLFQQVELNKNQKKTKLIKGLNK